MRLRSLLLTLAALVAFASCGSGTRDYPPHFPTPTTVTCADAPQLKRRGVDDRSQSNELNSDHEKIHVGNRASFFASLAIIADLKCRVTLAAADEALKPALEAARKAENSKSMYERAFRWGEADFIATHVIALMIQELPAPPLK